MTQRETQKVQEQLESIRQILFKKPYRCICDIASLAIIQKLPEMDIPEGDFIETVGRHGFNMGVVRTEVNNIKELMEMQMGWSRDLAGYEYLQHVGQGTGDYRGLTTVSIAEIVAGCGSVEITSIPDVREMFFNITKYIELIKRYESLDLHYKKPPDEDLNALMNLTLLFEKILVRTKSTKDKERKPLGFLRKSAAGIIIKKEEVEKTTYIRDNNDNPYRFKI